MLNILTETYHKHTNGNGKKKKRASIQANKSPLTLSEFKNMMKLFFGNLFIVREKATAANFIQRAENSSKLSFEEMIRSTLPNIFAAIAGLNSERKEYFVMRYQQSIKNRYDMMNLGTLQYL